jgi:hypothetical protein
VKAVRRNLAVKFICALTAAYLGCSSSDGSHATSDDGGGADGTMAADGNSASDASHTADAAHVADASLDGTSASDTGAGDSAAADASDASRDASDAAPDGSSASDAASDAGDAATQTTDASDAAAQVDSGDAGTCNSLSFAAAAVTLQTVDAAAPTTWTGGALVGGTYVATSATLYTNGQSSCPSVTSFQGTYVITATSTTAGTITFVQSVDGSAASSQTSSYTSTGTLMSLQRTCPATDAGAQGTPYSVSGSHVTFAVDAGSCGGVLVIEIAAQ